MSTVPVLPYDIIDKIISMAKKLEHAPTLEQLRAVHTGNACVYSNISMNRPVPRRMSFKRNTLCVSMWCDKTRQYIEPPHTYEYIRWMYAESSSFLANLRNRGGMTNKHVISRGRSWRGSLKLIRDFITQYYPDYNDVIRREGLPCLSRCDKNELTRIVLKA